MIVKTNRIRVKFVDGSVMELSGVSSYGLDETNKFAYLVINGYRQFFNFDHVLYIGRVFDLYEGSGEE